MVELDFGFLAPAIINLIESYSLRREVRDFGVTNLEKLTHRIPSRNQQLVKIRRGIANRRNAVDETQSPIIGFWPTPFNAA